MNLDESYNLQGLELEAGVREASNGAIRTLRESDDSQEHLETLGKMFEALGKSHSGPGKGIEWAKDLISTYRNLGRIIQIIYEQEQTDGGSDESEEFEPGSLEERARSLENL